MTEPGSLSRRSLIAGTAVLAGAAALAPRGASAQASPPANAQLTANGLEEHELSRRTKARAAMAPDGPSG